jgi:hypothetical protein
MSEQQSENRRIVVETPNERREVSHSETVRYPERSGVSSAVLAVIVVGVVVLAAIVILFVMSQNRPDTVNANTAQQPPQTTIVQQPAQQPPIVVQQPAPATQPAPVIVNQQPAPATGGSTAPTEPDDVTIQAAIDKKLSDSPTLSSLGITATVLSGKVTLMGTIKTEALKAEVERAVRNVKGVKLVDNQLIVG